LEIHGKIKKTLRFKEAGPETLFLFMFTRKKGLERRGPNISETLFWHFLGMCEE
jgi:hypothetical protein